MNLSYLCFFRYCFEDSPFQGLARTSLDGRAFDEVYDDLLLPSLGHAGPFLCGEFCGGQQGPRVAGCTIVQGGWQFIEEGHLWVIREGNMIVHECMLLHMLYVDYMGIGGGGALRALPRGLKDLGGGGRCCRGRACP